MGVTSGSEFLPSVAMMDRLGLTISWFPFLVGELEVLVKLGLGGINLSFITTVLTCCGVEPSLCVRLASLGVRELCVPLCAVSVALAFGSTVWRVPKVSKICGRSSMTSWSTIQIVAGMIFGTNRFLNNFVKFFH